MDNFFIKGKKAFAKKLKNDAVESTNKKVMYIKAIAKEVKANEELAAKLGVVLPSGAQAATAAAAIAAGVNAAAAAAGVNEAPAGMDASFSGGILRPDIMSILSQPAFASLANYKPKINRMVDGSLPNVKYMKKFGFKNSKEYIAVDPTVCQRRVISRLQARQASKTVHQAVYADLTKHIPADLVCARNRTTEAYLEVRGANVVPKSDQRCKDRKDAREAASVAAAAAHTQAYRQARLVDQIPAYLRCADVPVFE